MKRSEMREHIFRIIFQIIHIACYGLGHMLSDKELDIFPLEDKAEGRYEKYLRLFSSSGRF